MKARTATVLLFGLVPIVALTFLAKQFAVTLAIIVLVAIACEITESAKTEYIGLVWVVVGLVAPLLSIAFVTVLAGHVALKLLTTISTKVFKFLTTKQ